MYVVVHYSRASGSRWQCRQIRAQFMDRVPECTCGVPKDAYGDAPKQVDYANQSDEVLGAVVASSYISARLLAFAPKHLHQRKRL